MSKINISNLKSLSENLEKLYSEFKESYEKNNSEKFNKIKSEMIQLQRKIAEISK